MPKFVKSQEYPSLQNWNREDAGAFDFDVEVLHGMIQPGPGIPRICRLHDVEECRQPPSYCICQGVIGTRNQEVDVWVEEVVMRRECRDGASAPPSGRNKEESSMVLSK